MRGKQVSPAPFPQSGVAESLGSSNSYGRSESGLSRDVAIGSLTLAGRGSLLGQQALGAAAQRARGGLPAVLYAQVGLGPEGPARLPAQLDVVDDADERALQVRAEEQ